MKSVIISEQGEVRELLDLPDGVNSLTIFTEAIDGDENTPSMAVVSKDPLSPATQLIGTTITGSVQYYHMTPVYDTKPLKVFTQTGSLNDKEARALVGWYRDSIKGVLGALYTDSAISGEKLDLLLAELGIPGFSDPSTEGTPPEEDNTDELL